MKFSASAVLCCITAVAHGTATSLKLLDGPPGVIIGILTTVRGSMQTLVQATRDFSGNIQPVVDASHNLVKFISDSTETVKKHPMLQFVDLLVLAEPVKLLQAQTEALNDELKSRIPAIEEAKACAICRDKAASIANVTELFIDAMVSITPGKFAKKHAKELADKMNTTLAEAQAIFAEDKCKDID